MIPLFVGYAILVWVFAARFRRQAVGFAVVAAGLAGLLGFNWFHLKLDEWTNGGIYLPVLQTITYPYTALVVSVGVFIASLPRVSHAGCWRCGYSLHGLEPALGLLRCPECGAEHPTPTAYRRSGADREDFGASDLSLDRPTSAARHAPRRPGQQDQHRHAADQAPA